MLIGFIFKLQAFFFLFASAWAGPSPRIAPEVASVSLWLKVGLTLLCVSTKINNFHRHRCTESLNILNKVINKHGCRDGVCPRRRNCWKVSAINTGYQVAAALAPLCCDTHCAAASDLCFKTIKVLSNAWKRGPFLYVTCSNKLTDSYFSLMRLDWPEQTAAGSFPPQSEGVL